MTKSLKLINRKRPENFIKVEVRDNKIFTKNGFITIITGTDYVEDCIRPDIVLNNYIVPKDVTIET